MLAEADDKTKARKRNRIVLYRVGTLAFLRSKDSASASQACGSQGILGEIALV
jgi:hypothetical protein